MQWFTAERPKHGDTRTRSWFAWIPVRIGREYRWLEPVRVFQVYQMNQTGEGWFNAAFT
jgi:hypothetical protein